MELLQFSCFSRKKGSVIGVDVVEEMLEASKNNLTEAERINPWFKKEFVNLRHGDALNLPLEDNSIEIAAQNCLFNIFKEDDLEKALKEMYRVLRPNKRLPYLCGLLFFHSQTSILTCSINFGTFLQKLSLL